MPRLRKKGKTPAHFLSCCHIKALLFRQTVLVVVVVREGIVVLDVRGGRIEKKRGSEL